MSPLMNWHAYCIKSDIITFHRLHNGWIFKVIEAVSVVIWKKSELISPVWFEGDLKTQKDILKLSDLYILVRPVPECVPSLHGYSATSSSLLYSSAPPLASYAHHPVGSSENTERELESPSQLVVLLLLQQPIQLMELMPQSSKDDRHRPSP